MLNVQIKRTSQAGESQLETFRVEGDSQTTVLEVLEEIHRFHDPTLAFRYSCRIGLCGTCTQIINGKPGLSCLKKAEPGKDDILTVEPMPKGVTLVDLVKQA